MFTDLLVLAAALAALLAGARFFVDGVSSVAARLGVPPLIIGMTLVAFGTSLPELVINSLSAARGSTGLAFGNITGSCLLNIGFVLGLTALLHPLRVEPSLITREIPMLVVSVAAAAALSGDTWLEGAAVSQWGRTDGMALLLLFSIFLYYTVRDVLSSRGDAFVEEVREKESTSRQAAVWKQPVLMFGGLAGIWLGADGTVDRAVSIARTLGVSDALIGLTLLSFGTTLPELATCLMAVRRGHPEMALGNVVGSNIFNVLCIGGIVSVIRPVEIPAGGHADLLFVLLLSVVLLPIARHQRTVRRVEGAVLLLLYLGYIGSKMAWAV